MSRIILAITMAALAALGGLSAAGAEVVQPAGQAEPAAQAARAGATAATPEQPARLSVMPEPEPLLQKPSGFWTSGVPAVGGAYRYRLLAIGLGVCLFTAFITVWLVRRHPRRSV